MNRSQWLSLIDEFQNDPDAKGYAAMYAAMPTYVKELTQRDYDALPSQAMRDAYDADRAAWAAAYAVQAPLFVAAMNEELSMANRTHLSASEIFESIDIPEYTALQNHTDPAEQRKAERVRIVLGLGDQIDVSPGSRARAWLMDAFGGGSVSITTMGGLLTQTQPRWQALGLAPIKEGWFETLIRRIQRSA